MGTLSLAMVVHQTAEQDYFMGVVACGNVAAIKRLINKGVNVNFLKGGITPLDSAVKNGFADCVETLLANRADPNMKSRKKPEIPDIPRGEQVLEWTPLITAAIHDRPDCISLLLKHGADMDYRDINEMSALAFAVKHKSTASLEVLIVSGAEIGFPEDFAISMIADSSFHEFVRISRTANSAVKKAEKTPFLHTVAASGDNGALVKMLKEVSVDINVLHKMTCDTALHVAVREGHVECVKTLLERKANCLLTNRRGYTPAHFAAELKRSDVLQLLLEKGVNSNIKGRDDITPLHVASRSGSLACMEVLLKYGADVNAKNVNRLTPLHYAIPSRDKSCIELLVHQGAEVFSVSRQGYIPMDFAAMEGEEYFNMLLPSDVNKKSKQGLTSLHIAASRQAQYIEELIAKGADLNAPRTDRFLPGYTPLHMAAFYGNTKALQVLLKHKANVNAKDENGHTPLHISALCGSTECINLLVANGASVNAKSKLGESPLHVACVAMSSGQCIATLLEHGCQLEARDKKGHTPLYLAVLVNNIECISTLLDHGANVFAQHKHLVTPLEASTMVSVDAFQTILQKIPRDAKDKNGLTPLHCAAAHSAKCLKVALEQVQNVDVTNKDGATPLHLAAEQGIVECVKLLLKHGAKVNAVDVMRLTPLHRAASDGHADCCKVLLKRGAQVDAEAVFGWTPLYLAADDGHFEVLKVLVERGANIDAYDENERTILMAAAKKAHVDCVRYLIERDARLWK